MSGFMGSFLKTSEWIMRLLTINAIWLLFNIPIVYLLMDIAFRNSVEEVFTLLIVIVCLMPFIFFPATTAMYGLIRRWIIGKGTHKLFSNFLNLYKENYMRSLLGSLPFILLWYLWLMNYRHTVIEAGSLILYVYLFVAILFFALTNYFFADLVHFELGFFASLQKILFMIIFYIHYTLGAACATIIVIVGLYLLHPILLILFSGSTVTFIYFFSYHQIYLKAQSKVEEKN